MLRIENSSCSQIVDVVWIIGFGAIAASFIVACGDGGLDCPGDSPHQVSGEVHLDDATSPFDIVIDFSSSTEGDEWVDCEVTVPAIDDRPVHYFCRSTPRTEGEYTVRLTTTTGAELKETVVVGSNRCDIVTEEVNFTVGAE